MALSSYRIPFLIPYFVEMQRKSFLNFLNTGLSTELSKKNPIYDSFKEFKISFYPKYYQLSLPDYTPKTALLKFKTYSSKIYIPIQYTNYKTKQFKSHWIILANLPLMTKRGNFIINGSPRIIVNQIVRSPGIYYKKIIDQKKRETYYADLISQRGAWLRFEIDKKKRVWIQMKKTRKIPILIFFKALGITNFQIQETIKYSEFLESSKFLTEAIEKEDYTHPKNSKDSLIWIYTFVYPQKKKTGQITKTFLKKTKKFLFRKFFSSRTYDLGYSGRIQLNKKFNVSYCNQTEKTYILTNQDLLFAIDYLIKVEKNIGFIDDIDHLKNRRVRTSGELIQNQVGTGLIRLEKAIADKTQDLNIFLSDILTPKSIDSALREFFGSNPLSQFMDQTNPLAELTHKRRLSSLGPGGVTRETAGMDVRGIHSSHYGRICPIETPEGKNAGLVNSLTTLAKINDSGFIETPFYNIYKKQVQKWKSVAYFSPSQEQFISIAPGDIKLNYFSFLCKNRIFAKYNNEFKQVQTNQIEYMCVSVIQMISIATSLIPFLEHDDANRALMGSNMQRQAVPLILPERPTIGTGLENKIISDSGHGVQSKKSGKIFIINSKNIMVTNPTGRTNNKKTIHNIHINKLHSCKTNYSKIIKLNFFEKIWVQNNQINQKQIFGETLKICKKPRQTFIQKNHKINFFKNFVFDYTYNLITKNIYVPKISENYIPQIVFFKFLCFKNINYKKNKYKWITKQNFLFKNHQLENLPSKFSNRFKKSFKYFFENFKFSKTDLENKFENFLNYLNEKQFKLSTYFFLVRKYNIFKKVLFFKVRLKTHKRHEIYTNNWYFSKIEPTNFYSLNFYKQFFWNFNKNSLKKIFEKIFENLSKNRNFVHETVYINISKSNSIFKNTLFYTIKQIMEIFLFQYIKLIFLQNFIEKKNLKHIFFYKSLNWKNFNIQKFAKIRYLNENSTQNIQSVNFFKNPNFLDYSNSCYKPILSQNSKKICSVNNWQTNYQHIDYIRPDISKKKINLNCPKIKQFKDFFFELYIRKSIKNLEIYKLSKQNHLVFLNTILLNNQIILFSQKFNFHLNLRNSLLYLSKYKLKNIISPLFSNKIFLLIFKTQKKNLFKTLKRYFVYIFYNQKLNNFKTFIAKIENVQIVLGKKIIKKPLWVFECLSMYIQLKNMESNFKLNQKNFNQYKISSFDYSSNYIFFDQPYFRNTKKQITLSANENFSFSPNNENRRFFVKFNLFKYQNRIINFNVKNQFIFVNKIINYSLLTYNHSNQNTCINQTPLVLTGEWVQKGDLLADGAASAGSELALGKSVLVAYMPWEGYNFEDAILVNERLVYDDLYTSVHIEKYKIEVCNTQYGPETLTTNIPHVLYKQKLKLDSNGIIKVGSWVNPRDILVGKVTPIQKKKYSGHAKLLADILEKKNYIYTVRDTSLRVPKHVSGRVVHIEQIENEKVSSRTKKNQKLRNFQNLKRIQIYIAEKRKIQVGDKMSGRHGNKGIISNILPRQDMPYLADGTPIDIVLNPLGVPSRMNVGQIFECLVGLAANQLNINVRMKIFDEMSGTETTRSLAYSKLFDARLQTGKQWLFNPKSPGKMTLFDGRTGECFKQNNTVGTAYMLKLVHLVDEKIHARSTGPYSLVTQQPVRGRSKHGGQRLGEMEVWALEGFGAAYTLHELLTTKSDDIKSRYKIMQSILERKYFLRYTPESFKVLLSELQSLCLNIGVYGIDLSGIRKKVDVMQLY